MMRILAAASLTLVLGTASPRAALAAESRLPDEERLTAAALARFKERAVRLVRIAARVRTAAGELCDATYAVLGVAFFAQEDIDYRDFAARARLARSDRPRIFAVVEGLAADRAGLREGDLLLRIDGKGVDEPDDVRGLRVDPSRTRFDVEFAREGAKHVVSVENVQGCEEAPSLYLSSEVNAFGFHHHVVVTTGMMRFVQSDDELASILGHELAHNILKHLGFAFEPRWEAESDYLGSYLAARGGYDPGQAAALWLRRSRLDVWDDLYHVRRSHPTDPARIQALEATAREIRDKRERGEPLVPEYREP